MTQPRPSSINVQTYSQVALPHLEDLIERNAKVLESLVDSLVKGVSQGQSLLVFGSGHSALFPLELYHRAGGASFVLPLVADYLMPQAGPPVVRVLERTPGAATPLLNRAKPKKGEMIWIASQSGINAAAIDVALEAKALGLHTVAFTSLVHSKGVKSRHPSGKRLFEVCDAVVDLGGRLGDAAIPISEGVCAGPLSSLGSILLGHSVLVAACAKLETQGIRSVYTSVNTAEGELRNKSLEAAASERDPRLW